MDETDPNTSDYKYSRLWRITLLFALLLVGFSVASVAVTPLRVSLLLRLFDTSEGKYRLWAFKQLLRETEGERLLVRESLKPVESDKFDPEVRHEITLVREDAILKISPKRHVQLVVDTIKTRRPYCSEHLRTNQNRFQIADALIDSILSDQHGLPESVRVDMMTALLAILADLSPFEIESFQSFAEGEYTTSYAELDLTGPVALPSYQPLDTRLAQMRSPESLLTTKPIEHFKYLDFQRAQLFRILGLKRILDFSRPQRFQSDQEQSLSLPGTALLHEAFERSWLRYAKESNASDETLAAPFRDGCARDYFWLADIVPHLSKNCQFINNHCLAGSVLSSPALLQFRSKRHNSPALLPISNEFNDPFELARTEAIIDRYGATEQRELNNLQLVPKSARERLNTHIMHVVQQSTGKQFANKLINGLRQKQLEWAVHVRRCLTLNTPTPDFQLAALRELISAHHKRKINNGEFEQLLGVFLTHPFCHKVGLPAHGRRKSVQREFLETLKYCLFFGEENLSGDRILEWSNHLPSLERDTYIRRFCQTSFDLSELRHISSRIDLSAPVRTKLSQSIARQRELQSKLSAELITLESSCELDLAFRVYVVRQQLSGVKFSKFCRHDELKKYLESRLSDLEHMSLTSILEYFAKTDWNHALSIVKAWLRTWKSKSLSSNLMLARSAQIFSNAPNTDEARNGVSTLLLSYPQLIANIEFLPSYHNQIPKLIALNKLDARSNSNLLKAVARRFPGELNAVLTSLELNDAITDSQIDHIIVTELKSNQCKSNKFAKLKAFVETATTLDLRIMLSSSQFFDEYPEYLDYLTSCILDGKNPSTMASKLIQFRNLNPKGTDKFITKLWKEAEQRDKQFIDILSDREQVSSRRLRTMQVFHQLKYRNRLIVMRILKRLGIYARSVLPTLIRELKTPRKNADYQYIAAIMDTLVNIDRRGRSAPYELTVIIKDPTRSTFIRSVAICAFRRYFAAPNAIQQLVNCRSSLPKCLKRQLERTLCYVDWRADFEHIFQSSLPEASQLKALVKH